MPNCLRIWLESVSLMLRRARTIYIRANSLHLLEVQEEREMVETPSGYEIVPVAAIGGIYPGKELYDQ
jgi:hypothetical protein